MYRTNASTPEPTMPKGGPLMRFIYWVESPSLSVAQEMLKAFAAAVFAVGTLAFVSATLFGAASLF